MNVIPYLLIALTVLASTGCKKAHDYEPIDGAPDDAWAAFRNDPARTGWSKTAQTGRSATEAWRFEDLNVTTYGAAKGSASVSGDTVFVGSDDAMFRALDKATGELKWETLFEDTSQGVHGSPAIGDEHVYIGAYNGILYALDKETGDEAWRYEKGFQVGASPVLVPEHGRVYNTHEKGANGGGFIVSVDARTGEEVWHNEIRAHPHSSVAVSLEEDMLYVGDNLAIVHALDTTSGKKVWSYQLDQTKEDQSDIKTTPTVIEDAGLLVVGAWSDKVHAFDLVDGTLKWETDVGANIMGSTGYSPEQGLVYVGSLSPTQALHALDIDTGEEVWRYDIGSSVMSSPAINADGSIVVVGSHDNNLHAVDAATGELVWTHPVGTDVTGSPALHGTMVFITSKLGDLVAVETN